MSERRPHLLGQSADPLVKRAVQVVLHVILFEIQQHAQPRDLGVGVHRPPAGRRQLLHLPDQALHEFRRQRHAGPGIGPRQIVGHRRIEQIRNARQAHRALCLGQEPPADAAAAVLVLLRRVDQRFEQFQSIVPLAVMHTRRKADQHRGHARRPEQRRPVRLGHIACGGEPVPFASLVQAGPDRFLRPHPGNFPFPTDNTA